MPKENPNGIERENKHLPGDRSIENSFGVNAISGNETESPKESESEMANVNAIEDSEN